MKTKLFFLTFIAASGLFFGQYTTGTVALSGSGLSLKIDTNPTTVTLTISGSSTSWFGIGFNASGMGDAPDAFIYNSSTSRDYKLSGSYSAPSADASQDWTVISDVVSGSTRNVVATRSLSGGTSDYSFLNGVGSLDIIYARGSSLALTSHISRGATTVNFSTLAVDDVSEIKDSFIIAQNPVKDFLNFKISTTFNKIKIFDVSGKQMKNIDTQTPRIDIGELKSGVYYLEVETKDNGSFFQKFIKE